MSLDWPPTTYVTVFKPRGETGDVVGRAVMRPGVAESTLAHSEVIAAIAHLVLSEDAAQPMVRDPAERGGLVIEDTGREPSRLAVKDPYPSADAAVAHTVLDHLGMIAGAVFDRRRSQLIISAVVGHSLRPRGCRRYGQTVASEEYGVRIRQYVYFALKSETLPAYAITARLGIEPDTVRVRGTRCVDPPVPVCHSWAIECRLAGLTVNEQATRVLDRLRPAADHIRTLMANSDVSAILQVVRYFNADDGELDRCDPIVTDSGLVLQKLPGQHHLLGWHLSAEDLTFLASMPAELDVDEYG